MELIKLNQKINLLENDIQYHKDKLADAQQELQIFKDVRKMHEDKIENGK